MRELGYFLMFVEAILLVAAIVIPHRALQLERHTFDRNKVYDIYIKHRALSVIVIFLAFFVYQFGLRVLLPNWFAGTATGLALLGVVGGLIAVVYTPIMYIKCLHEWNRRR